MTQPASSSRPEPLHEARDLFLRLWAKELPTTRRVLERIPEGSDYRPDPKSRTAREIAWLIVREQIALVEGLERGEIRWVELPAPPTMAEVLALDDQHRAGMVDRLKALYAIHRNVATGPEVNAAPENTANLTAPAPTAAPEEAHTFVATVDPAAKQLTVLNTRTREARSFPVR